MIDVNDDDYDVLGNRKTSCEPACKWEVYGNLGVCNESVAECRRKEHPSCVTSC